MSRAQDALARMKGPVVPINVCFAADGTPDYRSVARYVDWLAGEGVPILMLTAGSSEFASLNDDEIWRLTASVAEANDGRSFFIASTGLWKPAVTRDFLVHADRVGADAVKLQFSNWLTVDRAVLVRYFDLVQDAADVPLLLLSGPNFPIDGVIELASRPNLIGIKNDGHPFSDYYDLLRGTADEDFGVISGGQMRNFMFGYPLGSPAYLCPIAPIRPALANEFYAYVAAGKVQEAWQFVVQYEDPWLTWAASQNWLASMKAAIHIQQLYPNHLLGHAYPHPEPSVVEEVRAKLVEVFGSETA